MLSKTGEKEKKVDDQEVGTIEVVEISYRLRSISISGEISESWMKVEKVIIWINKELM